MHPLLAVTEETMREAHGFANLLFLFLPIFLALVAGLCLLVLSMRRDLDAGKAASLSALAAVVCVGLFHLEAMRHGAAMHAAQAPGAPALAPDAASMQIQRSMEQISAENGMLRDRIATLEMELAARGGAAPAISLPAPRRAAPGAKAGTPPPIAIPPRPGGPPTPPDASVAPEMPKEATPGPEKDAAPKGEAPKPAEPPKPEAPRSEAPKDEAKPAETQPPAPPAPVDGGAGEAPKAGEKP